MTFWLREYTIQTVFVALQATVIIYGILITATLMKTNGYPEWQGVFWISKFVRHAGLMFFLVPAGWVWLTIWYDRTDRRYPQIFSVVTGLLVLILLHQCFSRSAEGAQQRFFPHDRYGYQSSPKADIDWEQSGQRDVRDGIVSFLYESRCEMT